MSQRNFNKESNPYTNKKPCVKCGGTERYSSPPYQCKVCQLEAANKRNNLLAELQSLEDLKRLEELQRDTIEDARLLIGTRWMRLGYDPNFHTYNGYIVLYVTNVMHLSEKHPPQVVYKGDNGKVWSLPYNKWPGSLVPEENRHDC